MRTRRALALTGTTVAGALSWAVMDYRAWRALGVGGLPPTPRGWLITTRLRLRGRDPLRVRVEGVADAEKLPPDLPERGGTRPRVAPHPIPHRVLGTPPSPALRHRLQRTFEALVEEHPDVLMFRTSQWERHNRAIFTRARSEFEGVEVGHVHPADGSAHVTLHPADAQRVIHLGWGELHPLAGQQGLPGTYLMLYPPRTANDIPVIAAIIAAAAAHHVGDTTHSFSRRP